jgi:hypothetical protein
MTNRAYRTSRARLTISEPWDQSKSLNGILKETNISSAPGLLFTSEENKKYVLSLRYKESQMNDIWIGKHVIVNIEEFSESLDSSSPEYKSLFGGSGSIELIENSAD